MSPANKKKSALTLPILLLAVLCLAALRGNAQLVPPEVLQTVTVKELRWPGERGWRSEEIRGVVYRRGLIYYLEASKRRLLVAQERVPERVVHTFDLPVADGNALCLAYSEKPDRFFVLTGESRRKQQILTFECRVVDGLPQLDTRTTGVISLRGLYDECSWIAPDVDGERFSCLVQKQDSSVVVECATPQRPYRSIYYKDTIPTEVREERALAGEAGMLPTALHWRPGPLWSLLNTAGQGTSIMQLSRSQKPSYLLSSFAPGFDGAGLAESPASYFLALNDPNNSGCVAVLPKVARLTGR